LLIVLILPVLGGSLIGPLSNYIPAKGLYLKLFWRFAGSLIFVIPYVILVERCIKKKNNQTGDSSLFLVKSTSFMSSKHSIDDDFDIMDKEERVWFKSELCALTVVATISMFAWTSITTWASLHTT